jgi:Tfp pilus assembly protein PilN
VSRNIVDRILTEDQLFWPVMITLSLIIALLFVGLGFYLAAQS